MRLHSFSDPQPNTSSEEGNDFSDKLLKSSPPNSPLFQKEGTKNFGYEEHSEHSEQW